MHNTCNCRVRWVIITWRIKSYMISSKVYIVEQTERTIMWNCEFPMIGSKVGNKQQYTNQPQSLRRAPTREQEIMVKRAFIIFEPAPKAAESHLSLTILNSFVVRTYICIYIPEAIIHTWITSLPRVCSCYHKYAALHIVKLRLYA